MIDRLRIRWMIHRDLSQVMAMEEQVFEFPWREDDFVRVLRQRNCIGMVAEENGESVSACGGAGEKPVSGRIVGFMLYELLTAELHVLNFAVSPRHRRRGIGRAMFDKLVGKLSYGRRDRIVLEVRETNLSAQLFFQACGFRAIDVLRDYYEDTTEDAYLMQYRYYPTHADVDWAYQRNAKLS